MTKKPANKSLVLFSVHIPVLLALLALLLIGVGSISRSLNKSTDQTVLSDNDERDDEDEDEEEKDDEEDERDEDERKDEDEGDDEEDRDENEKDTEDSKEREDDDNKYSITRTNSRNTEVEENHNDEDKLELVSEVVNSDGTVTKTYRKTEDDGKYELKAYVYDSSGKIIREIELNQDGTLKVDDDNEADDDATEEDENEVENENETEIEFDYKSDGNNIPQLPQVVEAELEQEIETNEKLGTSVDKVEIEIETADGEYKYKGSTFKDGKLFGLFDVNIPVGIEFDSKTGQIISVSQTFWSKLLDVLSLNKSK